MYPAFFESETAFNVMSMENFVSEMASGLAEEFLINLFAGNSSLNNLAENRQNYELLSFFNHNNEWNIHFHALAYRICDNYSAYIEGYEPLMHFIYKVIWKNKFLANMIEDEYEEIGCW